MTRIIDLGKVMATPAGEWRGDASYEFLSIVSHNGSGYISRVDNNGIEPGTNDDVWMLLVSAGKSPEITRDAKGNIYVNGDLLTSAFADAEAAAKRIVETDTSVRAAEQGRVNAENARVTAERLRVEAENLRQQSENGRKSNESARVNAEAARKNAETLRASAETSRASAEQARASSEQYRSGNETGRIAAFNEMMTSANKAISEARSAARIMESNSERTRVVVGRAIPAATVQPGVKYFCTNKFKFRIKARVNITGVEYQDTALFEKPLNYAISSYIRSKIKQVETLKGAVSWNDSNCYFLDDETGCITGFVLQSMDRLIDELATEAGFVLMMHVDSRGNTFVFTGEEVKILRIKSAIGTSPYLTVTDETVVCDKKISPLFLQSIFGEGMATRLSKHNDLSFRKIKRRKVTRNGSTVNKTKVKYLRKNSSSVPKEKHVVRARLTPICRHWRSITSAEMVFMRKNMFSEGD